MRATENFMMIEVMVGLSSKQAYGQDCLDTERELVVGMIHIKAGPS